ncbi:MAG TPA: serine hydroxymethyltransferase [Chloroflexota bacterium]|jgi:glycine hydroxymethyltransferase|nr:serine hydroxymethyltransferase [Chloroflexota bacterium]
MAAPAAEASVLARTDPQIAALIDREKGRLREGIELIASENYASAAVLEAVGSILTDKYAEGLPGRRYYGGCEFVDQVEQLAIDRAKALFQAGHANVQPHAGAQANYAAYAAVLQPGDTVMGLRLDQGGHLTHGSPVNFSGKLFNFVSYGVRRDDQYIDYEQMQQLAEEHKPKLIVAGATAYPRVWDFERIRRIADSVGSLMMTDMAHFAGLVAGGAHPSPVAASHIVTTTTHKTLRGPRGGMILCTADLARKVDSAVFPNAQGGPLEHVIAGKAVCFEEAAQPEFRNYARRVVENAAVMGETLAAAGLRLMTGGTDNHLLLVDVSTVGVTGKDAETALDRAGITVNKNAIPFDTQKPAVTSGIRVGTPASTTRGMGPEEMRQIGQWIAEIVRRPDDERLTARIRPEVRKLASQFPVPGC